MEEEKAAAYYDDLTRRGEGAARFKQGLGFSSSTAENAPARGSALPSSSASFLSNFVKASTPAEPTELENNKQAQLESIQNKLTKKKKTTEPSPSREPEERAHQLRISRRDGRSSRRRSRSRSLDRDRGSRPRSRSRERYRDEDRNGDRRRRRRRSRSRSKSDSDGDRRRRGRRRSRSPNQNQRAERRSRSRSRSRSPSRRERERGEDGNGGRLSKIRKQKSGGIDYSRLIEGYDSMSPAERVKAKMKLQLAETAEKDAMKGMGSGWERFEFNKDAPLDDEEDVEAAEDDTAVVKQIGQSFRFSAVESKREEQIRAAHDEAMFGTPVILPSSTSDDEAGAEAEAEAEAQAEIKTDKKELNESDLAAGLLSEKVLAKQQGSWRDRARRQRN
ncbi:hypothetical protein PanWU01x14_243470 [Parasponia andersonii]|uniref:Uncharacterized protein n=1 Tax=Parasponia andersonii TaxID=3476 RepID=A0A2P5BFN6_PARAD|nr:hypothetical protein PanWU01x14_243470 [Parasponia andersonii]